MSLRLPTIRNSFLFVCTLQVCAACGLGEFTQTDKGSLPPCDSVATSSEELLRLNGSTEQQPSETAALTILDFGPNNVEAGQPFNVQPSGLSAIWVKVDRPLAEQSFIRLNGTKLGGNAKGDRIGAQVPVELTENPGTLTLEIVQVIDGQEVVSAPVNFIVK